jgi:hypothetical protein
MLKESVKSIIDRIVAEFKDEYQIKSDAIANDTTLTDRSSAFLIESYIKTFEKKMEELKELAFSCFKVQIYGTRRQFNDIKGIPYKRQEV